MNETNKTFQWPYTFHQIYLQLLLKGLMQSSSVKDWLNVLILVQPVAANLWVLLINTKSFAAKHFHMKISDSSAWSFWRAIQTSLMGKRMQPVSFTQKRIVQACVTAVKTFGSRTCQVFHAQIVMVITLLCKLWQRCWMCVFSLPLKIKSEHRFILFLHQMWKQKIFRSCLLDTTTSMKQSTMLV